MTVIVHYDSKQLKHVLQQTLNILECFALPDFVGANELWFEL